MEYIAKVKKTKTKTNPFLKKSERERLKYKYHSMILEFILHFFPFNL